MGGASRLLMLLATPFPRPSALRLARHSGTSLATLSSPAASSSRCRRSVLPFSSHLRLGFSTVASEQIYPPAGGAREGFGEAVVSAPAFHAAGAAHPWPEWTKLVEYLSSGGYFGRQSTVSAGVDDDDDSFLAGYDLTEEFVKAAQACLCFARHRPDILRLLAKKDIEIIVRNGSPFLFKNGSISTRRLLLFLSADGANDPETLTVDVLFELDANPLKVLDSKSAQTVDVMRYLLSYSYSSHGTSDEACGSRDLIETSIRNLLAELVRLSVATPEARLTEPNARQTVVKHVQFSRPTGRNIEMKRGDWICQRCSFMNFARNMKCLQCNEARPKGVFPGGEWECPQCDFFNYRRNMTCLRCDCKRPGEGPLGTDPSAGSGHNRSLNIDSVIERKLAENDEKAERWFSKISQLNDAADFNSAINDEDFPEIMPMQKGMNRFVVSTRKTPLERRLANAQNNNLLANSSPEGNQLRSGGSTGMVSHKNSDLLISQTLDRILGRSSEPTEMNNLVTAGGGNSGPGNRSIFSDYTDEMVNKDPDYAPFVPLPADMFGKPCNTNNERTTDIEVSASMKSGHPGESMLNGSEGSNESKDKELSNASQSWSKKVSELDNALNQVNATSDDIPKVMPMRKGENRFVISKKKDCSLTSPQHKRWVAMQQDNSSNLVPFVPFPPGYFAKEDKQAEASLLVASASKGSTLNEKAQSVTEESEEAGVSGLRFHGNTRMPHNCPVNNSNHKTSTTDSYKIDSSNHGTDDSCNGASANSAQLQKYSFSNLSKTSNSDYSQYKPRNGPSISSTTERTEMSKSSNEGWKPSFSGKSLEGSAVTEPDPLDMSEEAKAARWFRRAAQIKDISELSNIPDEDFPEIMPMRKGINRFVVSKRKTPLERRLTSPQYRRNLPIISSESEKDTNK